jgi:hypothetical protein
MNIPLDYRRVPIAPSQSTGRADKAPTKAESEELITRNAGSYHITRMVNAKGSRFFRLNGMFFCNLALLQVFHCLSLREELFLYRAKVTSSSPPKVFIR